MRRTKKTPAKTKQIVAAVPSLRNRVSQVVRKMRTQGISLRKAAREVGISPSTVTRWGASALKKQSNGRYAAKMNDRLTRVLKVPTPAGPEEIVVRGSRDASRLGKYWAALQKYYETGETSALLKFRGLSITDASGKKIPLLTDLDQLNRLGSAGVVSFESLYARSL